MTREEAIKILADLTDNLFLHTWEEQYKALHAIKELWEATEKEGLVAVVRCKDCRHLYNKDFCSFFGIPIDTMDYCSHGERQCNYFGERREE